MAQASSNTDTPVTRYYNPNHRGTSGLTRERIRQIETIAMRNFQRELVKRGIGRADLLP